MGDKGMTPAELQGLLHDVGDGRLDADVAYTRLLAAMRQQPYENL